jgi:long-chain acyl-CoA synthetase
VRAGIEALFALEQDEGWRAAVAGAMATGRRYVEACQYGHTMPPGLEAEFAAADAAVLAPIRALLGLGEAEIVSSAAAPLPPEVAAFFAGLGMKILDLYGMTETTGAFTTNTPEEFKLGTVGRPYPGMEVRIADDGEILVRGPNVFLGYYKEPAATAEALKDGWLCTGDLGAFDGDGFLTITGRKKEIIITAGGKNIAPKNIEAAIKQSPLVGEAVVIGDRRKYLVALITLDEAAANKLAPAGTGPEQLAAASEVRTALQHQIDKVNETLARVEQVKKFAVLARPFGVATGELTPTLKIKRKVIAQMYEREIDAMYTDGE